MKNLFALLILSTLATGCWTRVDAGAVGVEINTCGGGVQPEALKGGTWRWAGPCTDIVEYPTYQQTLALTKTDAISVTSSEGLPINVDASMSFVVDGARAPGLYTKYRKDLEHVQETYMKQVVREGLQETFAKYSAQQLYSDKKESARAEVLAFLVKRLGADGFNVTQFTVNAVQVPEEVLAAIKQKVAMVQQAQRAEQEVKKTEAIGRQSVAQAEAEATAKKLRADAEAYANKKIAESISPTLVEYLRVQRWNGQMPQVTSGSTPFINLGK